MQGNGKIQAGDYVRATTQLYLRPYFPGLGIDQSRPPYIPDMGEKYHAKQVLDDGRVVFYISSVGQNYAVDSRNLEKM